MPRKTLIPSVSADTSARRPPSTRKGLLVAPSRQPTIAAFDAGLRQLGYVPGENLIVEIRITRANTSDAATHAAEFAHMDLDLVVAGSLPPALEVRKAAPALAMVIATCPGIVSNGFAG